MATILFVDRDQDLRRAVRAALARRGHTVRTCGDLARAIRCLEQYRFDGIFVEIWLGADSGFDLLTWIQDQQPRLAHSVVFVSGDIEPGTHARRKLRALGLPVIPKPFDIRDLEQQIVGWKPARGRDDARPPA